MTTIKTFLIFVVFIFFFQFSYSQNFEVIQFINSDKYSIKFIDTVNGSKKYVSFFKTVKHDFYNPVLEKDSFLLVLDTIIHRHIDTLKLIEELLEFEGDTRKSELQIMNYGKWSSGGFYTGNLETVSLQVHALFLINFIIFPELRYNKYDLYPILIKRKSNTNFIDRLLANICQNCYIRNVMQEVPNDNMKTNNIEFLYCESSTGGKIVKEAYKAYREWYMLVKIKGINEIKEKQIYPLSSRIDIAWY